MSVYELNKSRRTVRKFAQTPIEESLLRRLADAARVAPSGANVQPLRLHIVTQEAEREALFAHLLWGGYLYDGAPKEGERPMAYIIVAADESLKSNNVPFDTGAAMMAMTLCAQEEGIASCWIGSVNRKAVQELYALPDHMRVMLVLALGYPAQESREVPMGEDGSVRYWLDDEQVLNVPKRSLEDILF